MAVKRNAQLKRTESVQLKSIAAIDKATTWLGQVDRVKTAFDDIKEEVETVKADMNLGLKQYEAEIIEKMAESDARLAEKDALTNEAITDFDNMLADKAMNYKNSIEELTYDHNKSIDRLDFVTAEKIAKGRGLELLPKDTLDNHLIEMEAAKTKAEKDLKVAVNSAVKNSKEDQAKVISERDTEIKIMSNDLINTQERVMSCEDEINYLKTQLEGARAQVVNALAASKADVVVHNETKK